MRKIVSIGLIIFGMYAFCLHAQTQSATLSMADTGAYSIVERSDWRRFDNGRYVGLVDQEVRANILPKQMEASNTGFLFQGNFFVLQNTTREARQAARAIDAVIPVSFELRQNGAMIIENDQGFPRLRGFPAFPSRPVRVGERWQAPGSRAADPLNTGNPLIIPFVAEYEYRGTEMYMDTLVHRIHAGYASRYQGPATNGTAAVPANDINRVQGNHSVDILIRAADGLPVFMRDTLDVTYTMADGSTIRFAGFTLTFGQGIVPMDRGQVITTLGNTLTPPPEVSRNIEIPGIDIAPVPEGIRLTIRDIRFLPDSAEFLPEERYRLDLIAEALKQIPDRSFLVDGHTASVGRPAGEMDLSIERARRMVDELVNRGLRADRFIYKGWGGTRPVDDNSTDSGRNNNRRVEITILE